MIKSYQEGSWHFKSMIRATTKIIFIAVLLLLSCEVASDRIDASSSQSMKTSFERIHNSLPEGKKEAFAKCYKMIFQSLNNDASYHLELREQYDQTAYTLSRLQELLHNKNADEIIQDGYLVLQKEIKYMEDKKKNNYYWVQSRDQKILDNLKKESLEIKSFIKE